MKDTHPRLSIEPLSVSHHRETFACGVTPLDRYFHQQASQDVRRHLAAVFVLVTDEKNIGGYYTLSSTSLPLEHFPAEIQRRLPKYKHMPATLLGRLAVAKNCRGRRYGDLLLTDALKRSLRQSWEIASLIVVVDAKDDAARSFYEHYHFIRLPDFPHRLFLPMETLQKLFSSDR